MAGPNQSGIHAAIRTQITQRYSYGEDWSALFDQDEIPTGDWNGRLLNWINFKLGSSYTSYPAALQAFAEDQGFNNWASMNTIVFAYQYTNSEAAAVGAAMTTPPTNARAALIDTFVGELKTAGVWSSLDTMYVLAAADSQAALLNWKAPGTSFTAIPVNSPTFAADRGYTGDGSTARLRTQFTPSSNGANYVQDNASIWVWALTNASENGADAGNATNPVVFIRSRSAGNAVASAINSGAATSGSTIATSVGFSGGSRAASGTQKIWRNGAQSGTGGAISSTGVPTQEQWILGRNNDAFSTKQIAFAAWGAALTGKESAFYNAVLAYLQGVGAA